jgi:lipopolysaccharide/colanic/teichoic acid biosynthesis glycosyltransferase
MCTGAEQMEGGVYCTKGDKRVTKVGKFIRATSIDEIPQFINILKGDMSLIGPRPVLTYYPKKWEEYTEEELLSVTDEEAFNAEQIKNNTTAAFVPEQYDM